MRTVTCTLTAIANALSMCLEGLPGSMRRCWSAGVPSGLVGPMLVQSAQYPPSRKPRMHHHATATAALDTRRAMRDVRGIRRHATVVASVATRPEALVRERMQGPRELSGESTQTCRPRDMPRYPMKATRKVPRTMAE